MQLDSDSQNRCRFSVLCCRFRETLSHAIAAPSWMKRCGLEKATRRPSLSSQKLLPKEVVAERVVGAGGGRSRAPRPAKWRRARKSGSRDASAQSRPRSTLETPMCLIAARAHSFARRTPAGELAYVPLVTISHQKLGAAAPTRTICAEIRRGFLARGSGALSRKKASQKRKLGHGCSRHHGVTVLSQASMRARQASRSALTRRTLQVFFGSRPASPPRPLAAAQPCRQYQVKDKLPKLAQYLCLAKNVSALSAAQRRDCSPDDRAALALGIRELWPSWPLHRARQKKPPDKLTCERGPWPPRGTPPRAVPRRRWRAAEAPRPACLILPPAELPSRSGRGSFSKPTSRGEVPPTCRGTC